MGRRLCIALIVLTSPAIAQCSPGKAEQAAATAHQRQTELLRYQAFEMETQVPPKLSFQIASFKDALADAANATLSCTPPRESAAAIQNRLEALLNANQPEKSDPQVESTDKLEDGIYGTRLQIAVSALTNAPLLRAVTLSFGIECGDDTLLLLFEPTASGWHQLLRWQSDEYKEIAGAFGDFFTYAVILKDASNKLRLAVAHGTPWCTSRFSRFSIDILAPTHAAVPRVVWHTQLSYSRLDKVPPSVRATTDGFELRINDVTLDADVYERAVIYRYRLAGDQVERIAPIATNGRGFVEEWLEMPWQEAVRQTLPIATEQMKAIHERFAELEKDLNTYITYGPVRACQTKGRYQVQMNADPGGPQFYTIEERPTGYIMVNYSTAPDERCSGPDLMKKP